MPTPKGPEGEFSPGDVAERELTGEGLPKHFKFDRRDLEEEPVKDRDREPTPGTDADDDLIDSDA